MEIGDRRLFVGIKISAALQRELDKCPRGSEHYLKENQPQSLEILTLGDERLIGRFLQDGFPATNIENVTRNLRSILTLVTQGYRLAEDSIRIYANPGSELARPF